MKKQTFLIECHFDDNLNSIKKAIDKNGGYVVAVLTVPFWNTYGQMLHDNYAVVYQCEKELELEIKT